MPITKAYVDVKDGQVHYRKAGTFDRSPIVFLHMTAASSEAYDGIMQELDGKYPTIALDTPNYGESFRTTKTPTIEYIAEVTLEALSNLGLDKFHAFGHHTGASTAAEMAIQAPDRVLSWIPNGATYATTEELKHYKSKLSVPNPVSIKGTQIMWAWSRIKDNFPDVQHFISTPNQAEIMHRETMDMLRAGPNWNWAYDAVFTYDLIEAMKKVKCPVFFVSGADDVSYLLQKRAEDAYPQYPRHICPNAGVHYNETHPHELAPHLLKWVESVNENRK